MFKNISVKKLLLALSIISVANVNAMFVDVRPNVTPRSDTYTDVTFNKPQKPSKFQGRVNIEIDAISGVGKYESGNKSIGVGGRINKIGDWSVSGAANKKTSSCTLI